MMEQSFNFIIVNSVDIRDELWLNGYVNTFVVFIVGVPVRQPGECRTSSSRQCRGQVLCVPTVSTWI